MITLRPARASDAAAVAASLAEGFDSYRAWAPAGWEPPDVGEGDVERFAAALARSDVWFTVACDSDTDGAVVGHVALALSTHEDPGPPPAGTVFVWQLFVLSAWQGRGVATELMRAAVGEAVRRGFSAMALWTLEGAGRARRFYEREGFALTGRVHPESDFGLPTVQYRRTVA